MPILSWETYSPPGAISLLAAPWDRGAPWPFTQGPLKIQPFLCREREGIPLPHLHRGPHPEAGMGCTKAGEVEEITYMKNLSDRQAMATYRPS